MIDLVLLGLLPQANESPFLYRNIPNNDFKDYAITSSDFKNLGLKKFNFTEFTATQLANTTETTTISKARPLLAQRPKPNQSRLEPMKIFVWELCCSDNSQENAIIIRLRDHDNTRFSTLDSGYFKLARKYFSGFWHQKKKTFCFNCVDDPSKSIGSTFLKFRNQSFEVFSAKMYLVVC